jgi:hypothetical protein
MDAERPLRLLFERITKGDVTMPAREFARDVFAGPIGEIDGVAREHRENAAKRIEHEPKAFIGGRDGSSGRGRRRRRTTRNCLQYWGFTRAVRTSSFGREAGFGEQLEEHGLGKRLW